MLASQLFAIAHSRQCIGDQECHWCAGKCERKWPHDDLPPQPFVRSVSTALRPSSSYICQGCWLYRRPSVTVTFLNGGLKDRQGLFNHSWFLTPRGIDVITPADHTSLYPILLQPPLLFSLSFIDGRKNLIQSCVVNQLNEIRKDTELKFTMDGMILTYTIYELEEGIKNGSDGKMPGVRMLIDRLGKCNLFQDDHKEKGRPKREDAEMAVTKRLVRKSVQPLAS